MTLRKKTHLIILRLLCFKSSPDLFYNDCTLEVCLAPTLKSLIFLNVTALVSPQKTKTKSFIEINTKFNKYFQN